MDVTKMRTKTDEAIEVNVTGDAAVPVKANSGSKMQEMNQGFEGMDTIASFMPYFILDGSELLNKTDESVHSHIDVVLTGGKPVWQIWDESTLVAESFDGISTPDGLNMNAVLAKVRETAEAPDKIKIQARYEIFFDWDYTEDGTKLTKISLSPVSKFAFADYTKELTRAGLRLDEVVTRITAVRTTSKSGYRFSKTAFENIGMA